MRKQLLLAGLLLSVLPVCAQECSGNVLSRLYRKIVHRITLEQKLPWVLAVNNQTQLVLPNHVLGIDRGVFPPQEQPLPTSPNMRLFQMRMTYWQKLLAAHPVFNDFTFKVPYVRDALTLSSRQIYLLTHFLKNGTTTGTADTRYVPTQTEEFEHFLVRLTLPAGPGEKPVYLIANCYTHELFLSLRPSSPGLSFKPLVSSFNLH